MDFDFALIKSIKSDLVRHEITITIVVPLTEENILIADDLADYAGKDPKSMDVSITPHQPKLNVEFKSFSSALPQS